MHLLFITSNETGAGGILSRDLDLSRLVTLFLCTVFFFVPIWHRRDNKGNT